MIAIVDYGMSNLRSVSKAIEHLGAPAQVTERPEEIAMADKVILPGVGAFGDAMSELERRGLTGALKSFVRTGKPFFGICLGLQLLFEKSEESPGAAGLGFLKGPVKRFQTQPDLKVPHMGWNALRVRRQDCPLVRGVKPDSYVYFVHSYYVQPVDETTVLADTEYGETFPSMVWKENVYGAQFHPEKSQDTGLRILKNFVELPS